MEIIAEAFAPILGHPSWLVRKGHGSFVTLEFGEPKLEVHEPRMGSVLIDGAPPQAMQRNAQVHGQWHLWIYCCDWSLTLDSVELANNESEDIEIARALHVLNGQAMTAIAVDAVNGSSRFAFDLGCVLTTTPAATGTYSDEPVAQWMLYRPTGDVLTVRGDGAYQLVPGSMKRDDVQWLNCR